MNRANHEKGRRHRMPCALFLYLALTDPAVKLREVFWSPLWEQGG